MTENDNIKTETMEPEVTEAPATGVMGEITLLIDSNVTTASVRARLVSMLSDREIANRVGLLDTAITMLPALRGALSKVEKPDNVAYGADGKMLSSSYTKGRLDEIKKAREAVEKVEKAINAALDPAKPDFKLIKNLKPIEKTEKTEKTEKAPVKS